MADTDILVSEMTPASQINTTDLMIMTQPDAQAETGYSTKRGTVLQVANKMLKGTEYSTDLPDFTDKTPLGGLEELKADIKALLPIGSANGNPCNFETGISDTLVSLKASILASGGGGTPSTPIPIVGISSLDITRCGVNLWNEEWESGVYQTANGEPAPDANSWRSKDFIRVKPNTSYHFHKGGNQNVVVLYFYENDGTYINYQWVNANVSDDFDFTTPANCANVHFTLYNAASGYGLTYNNDISVNYPSTDTSYHAYNGQTFTIDLDGTRYGGYVDAVRGKLVVTYIYAEYDGSNDENWTIIAASNRAYISVSDIDTSIPDNVTGNILSNMYPAGPYSGDGQVDRITYRNGISQFNVFDYTNITSEEAWRALLSNTPLQVVYKLATPIEIDVSAISVEAVSGVNNIISNGGGDIEVEYRDSIQHYIDKKIAETQALIL